MPNLVKIVLKGKHSTIFAYGVTGSGKTHTMIGPPKQPNIGIISKSISLLFDEMESYKLSDK
jgi:hypothetical protein